MIKLVSNIESPAYNLLNVTADIRKKEDQEILMQFWPKSVAKLINKIYSQSEKSNEV